jgi:AraC family transcriptional regulator, regulatory protein of adaptative response / methylphosphotriester-DNA alkyltransferase methyltransferase
MGGVAHAKQANRTAGRFPNPPKGVDAAATARPGTIQRRRELFEEAAAIIALEYPERLALEGLARRLASSPRQLQRAFAEAGEAGFRSYLRRVRIERAAELLRDGWPVSEAARAVGYSQPAHFAKAFRRERGRLPRMERRRR